ncbi:hypothetical protein PVIIG_05193 [Plasmodium vivax India VII]|uniref:Uncharacterized protein n=1 Tax=Plasmodium vivax India VII TaxID=1077284 RepID=A0A0J9S3A3_PLAVI|nr:hypothetical protein PVIIG_05193 [Plasmodium vivax India VII]
MSGDILDVAKLEKDVYKVWDTYKEFDNPVDGDQYKPRYEAFCNPLMQQLHNSKEEHKNFCLKLLRNFGHYSENSKFLKFSSKDCNYLNNWVYNSIKKYSIPDKIITECFDDFKSNMQGIGKKDMCLYFPYEDNYKEAMNIIILDIFQSNIDIVIDIVGRENSQTDFRMQNYICECVNIYKEMNKKYCSNTYDEDQKKKLTCISLNTFKGTYDSFLFSTQHKKYKIPSLYNVEEDYLNMCEKKAPKLALTSQMSETSSVLQDETQYGERKSGDSPHLSSMNDGNQEIGYDLGLEEVMVLYEFRNVNNIKMSYTGKYRDEHIKNALSGNLYNKNNKINTE